ncbi:pilus assembly protein PilP [Parendozoicomonas haliclonae]|uniref:Pilus assembly protein, PilP n=1 Tax=Parendozoicomonas haliclonae TaxID=1960125 RepID=A0A1X7AF24_9GAMM|nr:pilus assembly protein PilP [Parendozoicomonas haliclonae]SMA35953.1 Pilus assembly protein, PilP [Parendozoicomonas haliclonae]
MNSRKIAPALLFSGLTILAGCDSNAGYEDLSRFMDESRARPTGRIEPLPQFTPYEAFTYSASGMRSPFDKPIKVQLVRKQKVQSDIRPDLDRVKQYLENFAFDAFAMVGTLSDDNGFFALLSMDGGVHRVRVGDYLGRNHGRIIGITDSEVQVIEIVESGLDNWVERPRTLSLSGS